MSPADREREQFEALITAYRQLPKAEPAPELDRAILEEARRAIQPERRQRPRWPALLATAATFTLAIGLAWQLRDDELRTQVPVGEIGPAPLPVPGDQGEYASEERADAPSAVTDSITRQAVPQAAERQEQAKSLDEASEQADDAPARVREQVAAPVLSAPAEMRAPKPTAPPAAEDRRKSDIFRDEEKHDGFAAPDATSTGELESAVATPAPEPEPKPFPLEEPEPAIPTAPPAAPPVSAAPKTAMPPMPAQAPAETSGVFLERSAADIDTSDPAAWLENIRRLLRQGQRERAREEFEAFRKTFPDAEVPDDLRELAR